MLLGPNGMGIAPETIGFQTFGTLAHPSLTFLVSFSYVWTNAT